MARNHRGRHVIWLDVPAEHLVERLKSARRQLLRRLDLPQHPLDLSVADVLSYIEADKKRRGGRIRWVLVGTDGITVRDDVPASIVEAATTRALAGPAH